MTAVKTDIGARDDAYSTVFAPTATIQATDVQRAIMALAAASGGASVTVSPTAPVSPAPEQGDLWWNDQTGSLFVYYIDANSSQWVVANGADYTAAVPAGGTVGQVLAKASGANYDIAWVNSLASIVYVIDGGGAVITTGNKGFIEVPFNCVITASRLFSDQTGSVVIDVQKDSYANFPPTGGDSIVAAAPPTLAAAQKNQDTTLTGWTTSLSAGDVISFVVNSVATITLATLSLSVRKV